MWIVSVCREAAGLVEFSFTSVASFSDGGCTNSNFSLSSSFNLIESFLNYRESLAGVGEKRRGSEGKKIWMQTKSNSRSRRTSSNSNSSSRRNQIRTWNSKWKICCGVSSELLWLDTSEGETCLAPVLVNLSRNQLKRSREKFHFIGRN